MTALPAISDASIALIKFFEGDPPPRHPEWPGEQSGITLGYGCDIGADAPSLDAWKPYLPAADWNRLAKTRGLTDTRAQQALPSVADIVIPTDASSTVFSSYSLPREEKTTLNAFPGAEQLPPDSLGALVSLVYNRGTSTTGSTRTEMAEIKKDLAAGRSRWTEVVVQIAAMTRLWSGTPTATNLTGRRLAEAALFARGIRDTGLLPGALIKGDAGDPVKRLQSALRLTADGKFGTQTMVAVWSAQPGIHQAPTGVADAATLTGLGLA